MLTIPRGVQNNNPLNIDYNTANHWNGQIPVSYLGTETRFCVFESPAAGIRAAIVNFQHYVEHDGCRTWGDIIARQAPSGPENDTEAYKATVHEATGFDMEAPAAVRDWAAMKAFVAGCVIVECGSVEYSDAVWEKVRTGVVMTA
jgi:hypothetical protein